MKEPRYRHIILFLDGSTLHVVQRNRGNDANAIYPKRTEREKYLGVWSIGTLGFKSQHAHLKSNGQ